MKILKYTIWLVFIGLVSANLYIFVQSMKISQHINYLDKETKKLHQGNLDLEKKAFETDSLEYAASMASQMAFTKKAEPFFLDNLGFALRNKP